MALFGEWRQICRRVFSWQQAGAFLILSIGLILALVMFAIGHGYSSYSLPYKDADRLIMIGRSPIKGQVMSIFPALPFTAQPFLEWKERKDLFADIAIFQQFEAWRLRTSNGNINLPRYQASTNFFDVLGLWFPELNAWKHSVRTRDLPTVLFTHGVGIGRFGPEAMGQLFRTTDGGGIIAGGILPVNFALPYENISGRTREFGVIPVSEDEIDIESSGWVIGRLAAGITPQIVEQALTATMSKDDAAFWKIEVKPLLYLMTESSRPIVYGSCVLGGLVLILCTANLSGILLVRCSYRLREYAIRTAMGATFLDLTRLLMMELAALSILAAGTAWFVGRAVVAVVGGMVPVKYLSLGRPIFGWYETVFLIAGTIVVAILSALAALVVIGRNYRREFSLGQFTVFHSQRWMRTLLTTGQVAIAMLLLSMSYIAVRGYLNMFSRDAGLDLSVRVVSVSHSPAVSGSLTERKSVIENTLKALRGGDTSAPVAVNMFGLFGGSISFSPFDSSSPVGRVMTMEEMPLISSALVSPGFLRTARIRLLAGRDFDEQDRGGEVLINATFAQRMGWLPAEAVGQMLDSKQVVIGVFDDFINTSWDEATSLKYFRSLNSLFNSGVKYSGNSFTANYIIHPTALSRTGSVERAVLQTDPDAVITSNANWGDLLSEPVRGQTFAAISIVLFTIAAIAIVVIGISNTVMFIIARRTRDIAIHVAIGAQTRHVCWFVVSDMVKAGIAGILAGGLASFWAGRTVALLIYNGDKYYNLTGLVLTSVAMIFVIALASLLPALRALRIEPSQALKLE